MIREICEGIEHIEEHVIERYRRGLGPLDDPAANLRPLGNVRVLDPPRPARMPGPPRDAESGRQ